MSKSKNDFLNYQEEQYYDGAPYILRDSFQPAFRKRKMNLLPNIWKKICKASARIDTKFFPLPVSREQLKQQEQAAIEQCAALVQNEIANCRDLPDFYNAMDAIIDFKAVWGNSVQVNSWVDTLNMKVRLKMNSIINSK